MVSSLLPIHPVQGLVQLQDGGSDSLDSGGVDGSDGQQCLQVVGPGDNQANRRYQARRGEDSQAHDVPQAAGHLPNARVVLEAFKAGHVHQ